MIQKWGHQMPSLTFKSYSLFYMIIAQIWHFLKNSFYIYNWLYNTFKYLQATKILTPLYGT